LGDAGKDGKKQGGEIGEGLGRKVNAGSDNGEGDSTAAKTRGSGISKTSIRGGQRWRGDDGTHNDDGTKFFRRIHVVCIRGGITPLVTFDAGSSAKTPKLTPPATELADRRNIIKAKILATARMSRMFSLLREDAENVSELKHLFGSNKLPYGTLMSGSEAIKEAIKSFDDARRLDIENERRPPLFNDDAEHGYDTRLQTPLKGYGVRTSPTDHVSSMEHNNKGDIISNPPASPIFYLTPPSAGGSHQRANFGTTTMSPSTCRWKMGATNAMIQEVFEQRC